MHCAAAVCGLAAQTHQSFAKGSKWSFITIPRHESLGCHTNEGFPYFYPIFLLLRLFLLARVSVVKPSSLLVIIMIVKPSFRKAHNNVIIYSLSSVCLLQLDMTYTNFSCPVTCFSHIKNEIFRWKMQQWLTDTNHLRIDLARKCPTSTWEFICLI